MLWGPQSILLPGGLCACHLVPTLCPRAPVPGVFRAGGLCQAAACCRRWKWFPDHREAKVRSPQHAARQEVASGQEQSPRPSLSPGQTWGRSTPCPPGPARVGLRGQQPAGKRLRSLFFRLCFPFSVLLWDLSFLLICGSASRCLHRLILACAWPGVDPGPWPTTHQLTEPPGRGVLCLSCQDTCSAPEPSGDAGRRCTVCAGGSRRSGCMALSPGKPPLSAQAERAGWGGWWPHPTQGRGAGARGAGARARPVELLQ